MKKFIAAALVAGAAAVGTATPASAASTTVDYKTATASGSSTSMPLTLEGFWVRNGGTATPYDPPTYDVAHIALSGRLYDGTFMYAVSAKYTQGRSYWYMSPTTDRKRLNRTSVGTYTVVDLTWMNAQRTKTRTARVLLRSWMA